MQDIEAVNGGADRSRLLNIVMQLRKCCNHPFLIDEQPWPATRDPNQFLQELLQASGKLSLIDSMLQRMKPLGHRVLIYSQFTTLLNLLEEWLAARQWGFQRIDGSVASAERQSRIDQFNTRPADNFVFLLSTKAGGLGINLASADTVVIYDSDWNPHNDLQAQARAHRLGQLKPVMIYRSANMTCSNTASRRQGAEAIVKWIAEISGSLHKTASLKLHMSTISWMLKLALRSVSEICNRGFGSTLCNVIDGVMLSLIKCALQFVWYDAVSFASSHGPA